MSSEQKTAIIRRLCEETSAGNWAAVDEVLAAESVAPAEAAADGAAHAERRRGTPQVAHDARLARIAAHVAEEAALLRAAAGASGRQVHNAARRARMNQQAIGDPTYVMGRSEEEARRLQQQAELLKPTTRALFEEAGIGAGMKVLDLGSGSGDVALLAAEMVGPTGRVVGVDLNPAIVATARARAQAAGLTQVSFLAGDLREVDLDRDFDAVVGRFVLMYQADPIAALGAALRAVRDDGLAVFYEANMDSGLALASLPVSPLHQLLGRCVAETFARGGVEMAMGTKLHQAFLATGLAAPQMRADALIGGGREWVGRFASYAANVLRSMKPLILRYGVATEDEIEFETFERRYLEEVLGQESLVQWFTCVGAWARKRVAM